jgi:hypothetical protein
MRDTFLRQLFTANRPLDHPTMRKLTLTLAALLLIGGSALAGSFRVHYSIRGSGRDVTVQAESSAEARRTVMDMLPGAVVTGVHRVE